MHPAVAFSYIISYHPILALGLSIQLQYNQFSACFFLWFLEKTFNTEKTNLLLSNHPVSQSPLPAEADRSWAPMDVEHSTAPASSTVALPAQTAHEVHGGPVYAATAIGGNVQNSVANVALSPRPLSANASPSGQVREP